MPELYSYNKDEIKNSLTIEQIESLVNEMGGESIREGSLLKCRTICHNGNSKNYIIMITLNYSDVIQIAERLLISMN